MTEYLVVMLHRILQLSIVCVCVCVCVRACVCVCERLCVYVYTLTYAFSHYGKIQDFDMDFYRR